MFRGLKHSCFCHAFGKQKKWKERKSRASKFLQISLNQTSHLSLWPGNGTPNHCFSPLVCDISVEPWRHGLSVTTFLAQRLKEKSRSSTPGRVWLHAFFFKQGFAEESAAVRLTSAELYPSGAEPHTEERRTVRALCAGKPLERNPVTHPVLCLHHTPRLHLFVTRREDAGSSRYKPQI